MNDGPAIGALVVGLAAVVVWAIIFGRAVRRIIFLRQRLVMFGLMALIGLLASLGSFASAVGYAQFTGFLDWGVPEQVLTFISSVGRGALVAGGVITLFYYWPMVRQT